MDANCRYVVFNYRFHYYLFFISINKVFLYGKVSDNFIFEFPQVRFIVISDFWKDIITPHKSVLIAFSAGALLLDDQSLGRLWFIPR